MSNSTVIPQFPKAATSPTSSQRLLWFALIAIIVWGLLMAWEVAQFKISDCKPPSTEPIAVSGGPIAALELASGQEIFEQVINRSKDGRTDCTNWNLETARVNTWMDYFFIALYWSTFWFLSLQYGGLLSGIVRILISLTAVFDVIENFYLLSALRAMSWQHPPTSLPVHFSQLKWALFGAATLVLGIVLARTRKICPGLMSALMILSALLTFGGIFHPSFLFPAILLLFFSLLIAIFYYFPFGTFSWDRLLVWLEFAYLIRFQIIAAALLAVLLPSGYFAAPSVFIGIFDALGWKSFTFIVAASLELAWTIMITARLVLVYGKDRFAGIGGITARASFPWSSAALFACLSIPCILMTCCGTFLPVWQILMSMILGFAIGLVFLHLTKKLHRYLEDPGGTTTDTVYPQFRSVEQPKREPRPPTFLDRWLQKLPRRLQPGILSPDGKLRSGHQLAGAAFALLLVIYVAVGIYDSPGLDLSKHPPAALFYVLFLLIMATWFFSGLAFFLDVLRLPVLTTFLAVSLVLGMIKTDHEFEIMTNTGKHSPAQIPGDVVHTWMQTRGKGDSNKPIVIVATAGGGIRASAWTAEVLTRLQESCEQAGMENSFVQSLLLVSSVSGGSVGSMYVIGSYDAEGHWNQKLNPQTRKNAAQSSLSAVGWGFLYPDLMRMTPILGSLTGWRAAKLDRGWALENAWVRGWDGHIWQTPPTIGAWRDDVAKGTRPAVIFNATATEAGQRFLSASTAIAPEGIGKFEDPFTLQFAPGSADYDMEISTAARLSATFPWVSPMPRASAERVGSRPHVADGGYYDNSGVLSASEWLLEAQSAVGTRPVKFILIDATASSPSQGQNWSWQRQIVAPVQALLAVRAGSQELRSQYELELVRDDLLKKGFNLQTFQFSYPSDPLTPLSWHLTPEQQRQIGKAWFTDNVQKQSQNILKQLACSK